MDKQWMVVLIVALVMLATVLKARYRSNHREKALGQDPEAQRLREEVRALKDRIAVLERIATDRESTLEREIEQLRDR